ncbi:MAG: hypothetical protein R3D85_12425 [Paracoccaceae bacterium]
MQATGSLLSGNQQIQASVFVIAAVTMLANLIVDLLYVVVDPRIRLS